MDAFLIKNAAGELEGVIRTEWGSVQTYKRDELTTTFRAHAGDHVPPYLDFILRDPPLYTLPVDWDTRPETPNALYSFQKSAIETIMGNHNGHSIIIADPGLGKTALAAVALGFYAASGGKVAAISPTSQLLPWQDTWAEWNPNLPKMQVVDKIKTVIKSDVVVVPYGVAKCHKELLDTTWDYVVLDESQVLKNAETLQSMFITPILTKAKVTVLLSATPMDSRPSELFQQLRAMYPETFSCQKTFIERYSKGYEKYNRWVDRGAKNMEELAALVKSCGQRIFKREVMKSLPSKTRYYVPFVCAPGGANAKILRDLETKRRLLIENVENAPNDKAREYATNLQKAHTGESLHQAGLIKTRLSEDWIKKYLVDNPDEKVVMFCKHLDVAAALRTLVEEIGASFVYIDGSVSNKKKRKQMIDDIRLPEGKARVAILTLRSCSTGITLCPGANTVFLVEKDYCPSTNMQAEDRVHRIGAVKPCKFFWFMLRDSADYSLDRMLKRKRSVTNAVIDENMAEEFTYEELDDVHEPKVPKWTPTDAVAPEKVEEGEEEEVVVAAPTKKRKAQTEVSINKLFKM